MYKLVLLLMFSTAFAIGDRGIMLDIYTERDPGTGRYNLMCDVAPNGTQHVRGREKIKFNIQTRSHLEDFWCNANGKTVYNSPHSPFDSTTIKTEDGGKTQLWKLSGDYNSYEKATMDGNWTCIFYIKKAHDMEVNAPTIRTSSDDYVEGNCELQFQITAPRVFLDMQIIDSNSPAPRRLIKGKLFQENSSLYYDYFFMDGEKVSFNCTLNVNGAAANEKNYALTLCINDENCGKSEGAKTAISNTFTLKSVDQFKNIVCTGVNVPSPDHSRVDNNSGLPSRLYSIIHLHYVPRKHTEPVNPESQAPPPTQEALTTTDVTQEPTQDTPLSVTWPIWTLCLTVPIAVFLLVGLVLTILKCRKTGTKLENTQNKLKEIEERERQLSFELRTTNQDYGETTTRTVASEHTV